AQRVHQLAGGLVDPVVPAEVTGIVQGDGAPVHGSLQGQPSLGEELLDQLGVVDHLEETAQGTVLVLEGVVAVGAGGDDPGYLGALEGVDVLPGQELEEVLVPHSPGGVAGADLLLAQDGEVDPRRVEDPGQGPGRPLGPLVEGDGTAHPVEVVDGARLRQGLHVGQVL